MERLESRSRNNPWFNLRNLIPLTNHRRPQLLGNIRHNALHLRNACKLYFINRLSRPLGPLTIQGNAPKVRPRRNLLAHCRLLLAHNPHSPTKSKFMGMGTICIRVVMRTGRYDAHIP